MGEKSRGEREGELGARKNNVMVGHLGKLEKCGPTYFRTILGRILLRLFRLFLFWFRNNRIHGISISKRMLLHVSDLDRYFHSDFFNRKPAVTGVGSCVVFPTKISQKNAYSVYSE